MLAVAVADVAVAAAARAAEAVIAADGRVPRPARQDSRSRQPKQEPGQPSWRPQHRCEEEQRCLGLSPKGQTWPPRQNEGSQSWYPGGGLLGSRPQREGCTITVNHAHVMKTKNSRAE